MENIINHVLKSQNESITSYFTADRAVTINGRTINGHNGVDIVPRGAVITPCAGTVTYVKNTVAGVDTSGLNDFGNNVKIKVSDRYLLRFCHLAKDTIPLKVGDTVKAGGLVGQMGGTGFSTGIHLHFGLYDISRGIEIAVDPLPYLTGKLKITTGGDMPNTSAPKTNAFRKGDKVRVNAGTRDYNGAALAAFVYSNIYEAIEMNGDRVVVGVNGAATAAVKADYLTLVAAAGASEPLNNLTTGNKVKVRSGRTAYDGAALASFVYQTIYTVMEIGGKDKDRIIIGDGKNVTAAVRSGDLYAV